MERTSTFSIVGRCEETGQIGVAVASRYLAVGAVVPTVEPGLVAIAHQCCASQRLGRLIVQFMKDGASVREALDRALSQDAQTPDKKIGAPNRQIHLIDTTGNTAAHTGDEVGKDNGFHASHKEAANYSVAGNCLTGPEVITAMADGFEEKAGGQFSFRLLHALKRGEEAGGDARGKQAAALMVASGTATDSDLLYVCDLRVDDHPEPVQELERLCRLKFGSQ